MVDVAQLAIKVDTTDLARGEAALEGLTKEGIRAQKATTGLGGSAAAAGRATGAFGRSVQNASFQVGDFATQIASGQRATTAFAQQFPQLVGGFGVWGAAIGAVVAVGAALIPVLFEMGDAAYDLDDALDDLEETTRRMQGPLKVLQSSTEDLIEKYGEAATRVREFAVAQAELEAAMAARRLADEIGILEDALKRYSETSSTAFSSGTMRSSAIANIARDFGLARDEAAQFERLLFRIKDADTFDEQSAALENVVMFMRDTGLEAEKLPPELQRAISEMITLTRETDAARALMAQLAGEAAGVSIGVPLYQQGFDNLLPPEAAPTETPRARRAGGGGRGPADTFARDLERLTESLRSEQEIVDEWYSQSQALLADRRAQEILSEQDHRAALLGVEQEYQSRLLDIRLKQQDATLGYTSQFFGAMAQATAAGGEKMAKAARVFGAIEATVNAYRAAAQALADPSVPFWGKAAAYASVLATGLSAVAAIKGGGSASRAVNTATSAVPESRNSARVALTLVGSDTSTFTGKQVRDLINQINQATEDGAIVRLA